MAEVPESERSTAQVLETPVDCLGRSVAGAGAVEEREDVRSALLQGPAQSADLDQRGRNAASDAVDHGLHHLLALDLVGFLVGGDDALVDAPGRFDLYVVVVGEQRLQTVALLVGEEAVTGVQGAADLVERIPGTAPMPEHGLLNTLAASVEPVASESDNVEGIHHRDRVRQLFSGGGLETGEPVHRDDLAPIAPLLGPPGQPLLENGLRSTLDHVQEPGWSCLVPVRGEIDDHRDIPLALACVAPDMLIDADRSDAIEPVRVIDQTPLALGENRRVRRRPRHPEPCGDAGDGQMVQDQARQPQASPPREIFARSGAAFDVSCRQRRPHPVHLYRRTRINSIVGRCPIWFVREAPRHRVSGYALAAALAAPAVRFEYPALQHSALGRQVLPYRLEAELIEAAEQGQIWCKESRLGHVEVFRMGSVRTSILRETSTPIPSATRSTDYTLVREEPINLYF